jgi:mRNA-degrading endonuclease toxin of MazEF toxin-antitoxin module
MVEQAKSVDFRSREARRIGRAPDEVLDEALSILDACIF